MLHPLTVMVCSKSGLETITGAEEPLPRWEMCIHTMNKYFSLAVGALYSKHTLTEKGKSEAVVSILDIWVLVKSQYRKC